MRGVPIKPTSALHPFPNSCITKNRRLKSCVPCRLSNRKCEKQGDSCKRCLKQNLPCIFSNDSTRNKAFKELQRKHKMTSCSQTPNMDCDTNSNFSVSPTFSESGSNVVNDHEITELDAMLTTTLANEPLLSHTPTHDTTEGLVHADISGVADNCLHHPLNLDFSQLIHSRQVAQSPIAFSPSTPSFFNTNVIPRSFIQTDSNRSNSLPRLLSVPAYEQHMLHQVKPNAIEISNMFSTQSLCNPSSFSEETPSPFKRTLPISPMFPVMQYDLDWNDLGSFLVNKM